MLASKVRTAIAITVILLFAATAAQTSDNTPDRSGNVIRTAGRTITTEQGAMPADAGRGGLLILQFQAEPSDEQLDLLKSAGVELIDHLDGHSYWVHSAAGGDIGAFQFIRAVVRPTAADKITPPVEFLTQAHRADESLDLTITFFPRTSFEEAFEQLVRLGATTQENRMLYGNRLEVQIPAGSVDKLAGSDLVRAVEPGAREKIAYNLAAARTSSIDKARNEFNLTGKGVLGGIWDEGAVADHPDLANRVIIADKGKISEHATHVAGTIIGNGGGRSEATGMAPEASLVSFNFRGDIPTEMADAARNYQISFSNNSWGYANGWSYHSILKLWIWWGDYFFGHYSSESAAYDELIYKTDLIILFAAGNDRADNGTTEKYLDPAKGRADDIPHPPDGPYRTIDITSSAKNVISVGAVTRKGKMTGFSSWGPTKDGRIKPEVVTNGTQVLSTLPGGEYAKWSGTSMASPTAAGGIALLMEQYLKKLERKPTAAEIRALIAATAHDLGRKGPDYSNGFGLLDELNAAELIADSKDSNLIISDKVRKAKTQRTKYYHFKTQKGTELLKVALAWIDPPAQPNAASALVNDLDIRLYRAKGSKEFLPWVLDCDNPSAPATTGTNTVDNIELVEVENPLAGKWVIEVKANRLSKGNMQKYALVVFSSKPIKGNVAEFVAP